MVGPHMVAATIWMLAGFVNLWFYLMWPHLTIAVVGLFCGLIALVFAIKA